MHRAVHYLAILLLSLLAWGCATDAPIERLQTITGTVTYFPRVAMPANAVVEITLVEVHASGTNRTIVEKKITGPDQVPVSFTLVYDPTQTPPGYQYAVHARILFEGKPWYVTKTVNHQMLHGRIAHADIILQPAR